jgi:YfiH family protein
MPTQSRFRTYVWNQSAGLPLLGWPALDARGVRAAVTTREAGNLALHVGDDPAEVLENRKRLAKAIGRRPGDLVFAQQAHGAQVTVVGAGDRGRGATDADDAVQATDALVTATPGVVLAVLVADCVPLILVDPVRRVLACVHAGWRGTVAGVTPATVAAMVELGSDPKDVVACVGPAIAPERYQVGDDVRDAATAAFGDRASAVVTPDGAGRWRFDLWSANELQLADAGVRNVQTAELDTGPDTPFFSHRSEAPCGRFGVFAYLQEES